MAIEGEKGPGTAAEFSYAAKLMAALFGILTAIVMFAPGDGATIWERLLAVLGTAGLGALFYGFFRWAARSADQSRHQG